MHVNKLDIPVQMNVPGATARQLGNFGTARHTLGAEYFTLAAGVDIAPLLTGLDDGLCHAPHWGYLINGRLVVTYGDRSTETCSAGELFYWPPGHTVRVEQDAELVMFSAAAEHLAVINHMLETLSAVAE